MNGTGIGEVTASEHEGCSRRIGFEMKGVPLPTSNGEQALLPVDLLANYQSIRNEQRIGWTAQRQFLRCLGVGGQSVVYLSVRQGADAFRLPVALKLFSPEFYNDAASYEIRHRQGHCIR